MNKKVNKKFIFRIIVLAFLALVFVNNSEVHAQTKSMRKIERSARKGARARSPKVIKAEKKAAKKKKQQQKAYEKAKKDDIKRRMSEQSPRTIEQMKETKRKSKEANKKNRVPFFKKIFKRKK